MEHISRVHAMAAACCGGDASTKGSPALKAKLMSALDYWLQHDFQGPDWWHNMIGVPMILGRDPADAGAGPDSRAARQGRRGPRPSQPEEAEARPSAPAPTWYGSPPTRLSRSSAALSGGAERCADAALRRDSRRGARPRGNSGGRELPPAWPGALRRRLRPNFTDDCTRWVEFTQGTRFAPSPEQSQLLEHYVLDGQQWMVRGAIYDYGVVGRELVRRGKDARGLVDSVERLAKLPGPRRKELSDFAARLRGEASAPPLVGNRHFWKSDYMAHQRAGYFTSARMYSTRMSNTDSLTHGENKQTHHIADGAAFIYRTGKEYRDIFPVWDWRRVPGTTSSSGPSRWRPSAVRRNGQDRASWAASRTVSTAWRRWTCSTTRSRRRRRGSTSTTSSSAWAPASPAPPAIRCSPR